MRPTRSALNNEHLSITCFLEKLPQKKGRGKTSTNDNEIVAVYHRGSVTHLASKTSIDADTHVRYPPRVEDAKPTQAETQLRDRLATGGLDIVHPFQVDWYNQAVENHYRLPTFDRSGCLALLIANTKALWPPFRRAVRERKQLRESAHPLDDYVESQIVEATASWKQPYIIRYGHSREPHPVAMQRLGAAIGFAAVSASHLSVHPTYGPWFSFRAVIMIDTPGPSQPPPPATLPCNCSQQCAQKFSEAMAQTATANAHSIRAHWKSWIAVRDACPTGTNYRFCDTQLAYHYTKDRSLLQ